MSQSSVVDVRTPEEFASGHVPGSVNIPLSELHGRMAELQAMSRPIILCCRSGQRSGMALEILRECGIADARNGGAWQDVLKHNG